MTRIYLDNAATSWPKPESVYRSVDNYQRQVGVAAGRSSYQDAIEAGRLVDRARRAVAQLLGINEPSRVVFTLNGTDSLNMAILGTLRPGDHVVTSVVEHNSVLRPLRHLEKDVRIEVSRIDCDGSGIIDPDDVRRAIKPQTRLVVLTHVSNVTGAIQPIAEVGAITRDLQVTFLLDAAQSVGHLSLDAGRLNVDLLAAPGHKGMLGPLGTGVLLVAPGLENQVKPLRYGGTGTQSEIDRQPDSLPEKLESGNLNVPGIAGVGEGAAYVNHCGIDTIRQHEMQLTERLLHGLAAIDGVSVQGPADAARQVGVVSFTVDGYDSQEIATTLDAAYSIQIRAGLHCAPGMHRRLGTAGSGGTARISIGPFTTDDQIDSVLAAVTEISSATHDLGGLKSNE